MAEKAVPNVTVRDISGGQCKSSINLGASLLGNWVDKSNKLQNFVEAFSDAIVVHRSDVFSHGVTIDDPPGYGTGAYRLVDFKARVVLRDPSDDSIHTIQIPAPKESLFEEKNGDMVVTEAAGAEIVQKLQDELGLTWQFLRGEMANR